MLLSCNQCIGCRLEKARVWAVRCLHESQLHELNCFITLTYSDESLPPNGSLVKRDFQLFMKKLRKKYGSGIRFYACGEYGDSFGRPHYHACIFGFDFPDKIPLSGYTDSKLWISESLNSLWPNGYATIGEVTFETAAYVARYVTKKLTGKRAIEYEGRDPEFALMSRRPGIGSGWFEKYSSDVYPSDEVIIKGKQMKPPRYYDSKYEKTNPDDLAKIKETRTETMVKKFQGLTNQELRRKFLSSAKHALAKLKLKQKG